MTNNLRPHNHRLLQLATGLLLLGVLAYLLVGSYLANQLTEPKRQAQRNSPAEYALKFEELQVRSRDQLALATWFIPAESDSAVLLVHGLATCRSCEFDGRFVEFASQLHNLGLNILMIDLRAHGQSEGSHVTFGVKEKWDVLGAIDWLEQRGFKKIGLLGVSLGAASTVEAAVDPHGGDRAGAIVLDSCFSSVSELLQKNFPEATRYPVALLPGGIFMARLLFDADFNSVRPSSQLPRIRAHVMLIYAQQDRYLPLGQINEMISARRDSETWIVSDAGHARIYNAHPQEYVDRVGRFFAQSLR